MDPKNITLLLVMRKTPDASAERHLRVLISRFQQTLLVTAEGVDNPFPGIPAGHFGNKRSLARALNEACSLSQTGWVFLMEADEQIQPEEIDSMQTVEGTWQAACFTAAGAGRATPGRAMGKKRMAGGHAGSDADKSEKKDPGQPWYYEARLIPLGASQEPIFQDSFLPDAGPYIRSANLAISGQVIQMEKQGSFIHSGLLSLLAGVEPASDMDWYWKGIYYSEKQQYGAAEKCFRRAVRNDHLLIFYQLSSLNGLANALLENNKLDEALQVADRSAILDRRQFAPWLIRHKVYWMRGQWKEAYQALCDYLQPAREKSRANLDFFLQPADAHYLMAEISLILKDYRHGFQHLEQFYELNRGGVSNEVIDKLFVYAAELGHKSKAVEYLDKLFYGKMKRLAADPEALERILGAASLFEEKGWNREAGDIYERLSLVSPGNQEVKRRWLTSLIRSEQISRARKVANL